MDISDNSVMVTKFVNSLLDIRHTLRLVYQHAVSSVDPCTLIHKELKCVGNSLYVGNKTYKLDENVHLIGIGKAALGMGYQSELKLGNHLKTGILSIPLGQRNIFKDFAFKSDSVIKIFEGAENNIPDAKAEIAAKQVVEMIKDLDENDIVLALISGGGSALLPLPIPPVTLEDKVSIIKLLQNSGADIGELNTVRKKLSLIKGGGLLKIAHPAEVIALILSDIVGDPLDLIASAPTVYTENDRDKLMRIFEKYSLLDKIPMRVKQVLEQSVNDEQPNANVHNLLIGTNRIALQSALEEAKNYNYETVILTDTLEGLVSDIYVSYVKLVECVCQALSDEISKTEFLDQLQPYKLNMRVSDNALFSLVDAIYQNKPTKLCILLGGEPTVKITGSGKGGRSQQLSLQFSDGLNKLYIDRECMDCFNVGLLCAGTDGIDGPTDAAGAISYNGQMKVAQGQNLDPSYFIQNCDAYTFFSKLSNGEDLIKVGHTGTNVMDIHILLIEKVKT